VKSTDKPIFGMLVAKTWRFYGKTPSGDEVADWFELLEGFDLDDVATALKRHLTDPDRGQYLPKPADIIRHLSTAPGDDGHPGADEAWGLLVRLIQDERETGVLTDEMRAGWAACGPVLDLGDAVGARRTFIEAYTRAVAEARVRRTPARWTVTLGTCPQLRAQRLAEAVQAKRLSCDQVTALLPGPAPASLDQVAGLLEGPDAPRQDAATAQRLRALAALLRAGSAEAEAHRAAERQEQREREADRKQTVQRLLDQRATAQGRDAA
jgi:hypothetical protein